MKALIALALLAVSVPVFPTERVPINVIPTVYRADVRSAYVQDGDTIRVSLRVMNDLQVWKSIRLRCADTPPVKTTEGLRVKLYVQELVSSAKTIVVRDTKYRSYNRMIADVWIDGKHLNADLLEKGYAVNTCQKEKP